MDKIAAMRAFVAVVEHDGFAAAARALGLSRSVVNRQVIQLEDTVKTQLLVRNTRKVSPTQAGLAYYDRCVRILADIEDAELELDRQTDAPRGLLRVNAPMSFGTMHLAGKVGDFCKRYPEVSVQLQLDDRFIDPIAEGYDVTIRVAALQDSALIARRIATARMALVASPDFLKEYGPLVSPDDLARVPCLHQGAVAAGSQWTLEGPDGTRAIPVRGRFGSNNGEATAEVAARGLGVAMLPTFIACPFLREGRLVPVLEGWEPAPVGIHAIYAPNRHMAPKVRSFIDFLVEAFGGTPYWDRRSSS
ncbi:MAG: LysR family transcriptional regulator [Rhodobiaceae bacterium]|nr:LysR family transcriptional regulator [Rhodobiaceae bacterium]